MVAIEFENLTKVYQTGLRKKTFTALTNFSLSVEEGEVFGFLGLNGAGKSTAIKVLLGLIKPTSGRATIFGQPGSDPAARHRIGFLPENPYLYDHLNPNELISFAAGVAGKNRNQVISRGRELLERLSLTEVMTQPVRLLSKGMTQKMGFIMAIIHDPDVIILDEPMNGLDPLGRRIVADIITELQARSKTVFFTSHILNDVSRLCRRVAIIHRGSLHYLGRVDELYDGAFRYRIRLKGPVSGLTGISALVTGNMEFPELLCPQEDLIPTIEQINNAKFMILSIEPEREELEDVFIRIVTEGQNEPIS
ncbi:MAG: ABC transporter ATP-binding protein [Deltaproteobacteria bacterium]|nr:ABC transporter ATP-binding protein [Deltaproteobacteria bacterium]